MTAGSRTPGTRARDFYIDWDRAASDVVAILRSTAGRDPHDRDLSDLVGELSTQSDEFRTRWAAHNVRFHDTGTKEFHHPLVGDITTTYNRMDLAADPGLAITIYTAEPGSKSAEASASSEAGPRRLNSRTCKQRQTIPKSATSARVRRQIRSEAHQRRMASLVTARRRSPCEAALKYCGRGKVGFSSPLVRAT